MRADIVKNIQKNGINKLVEVFVNSRYNGGIASIILNARCLLKIRLIFIVLIALRLALTINIHQ
jgi:hypothetical protein